VCLGQGRASTRPPVEPAIEQQLMEPAMHRQPIESAL
jgi:hypothetical protein